MKVDLWPIANVRPYDRNPRKNDSAVAAVAASLKEFGFRQPIVVDADGVIVVGHTRWKAAKQLGLAEVPVHVADLTPAQAKAYRLADNQTATLAEWDMDLLPLEIGELKALDFDLAPLGFGEEELGKMAGFDIPETVAPELDSGGKSPFVQMTFTLHEEQQEIVAQAISEAIKAGCDSAVNENSNGNAITVICEAYLG